MKSSKSILDVWKDHACHQIQASEKRETSAGRLLNPEVPKEDDFHQYQKLIKTFYEQFEYFQLLLTKFRSKPLRPKDLHYQYKTIRLTSPLLYHSFELYHI